MRTAIYFFIIISLTACVKNPENPVSGSPPPMGWNSWNWHGKKDINEQLIKETIDAIVNEGLRDAGYVYVVVDGGWRDTKLGADGELMAHPDKFPGGMKALADYAHSKGLKFGLHSVPGTHDCGGDEVGGYGLEEVHLAQFIDWGIDFLKLDLCRMTSDPCVNCEKTNTGWSEQTIKDVYVKWNKLIKESGSNILFSISAYKPRDWYPEYCNMARTTFDIRSRIHNGGAYFNSDSRENRGFLSIMTIAELNNEVAFMAGNGYWNDPDMMVTGEQGLNQAEQESHFALWAIMSSPLFLGNDPRVMSVEEKELILNEEIIAINQDPTEQGVLYHNDGLQQIWIKELKDNKKAILLLNLDEKERNVALNLKEAGIKGRISARDVINKKELGRFKNRISFNLSTNECRLVLIQ
jgi:alpha-galactosidase